jgi:hypothetical protein
MACGVTKQFSIRQVGVPGSSAGRRSDLKSRRRTAFWRLQR